MHVFNPNTWETEADRSLSLKPAWSTECVPEQPAKATQTNPVWKTEREGWREGGEGGGRRGGRGREGEREGGRERGRQKTLQISDSHTVLSNKLRRHKKWFT